jgi:tRNA (mo5U34)-methyltransferase
MRARRGSALAEHASNIRHVEEPAHLDLQTIRARVQQLGPWFHNLDLQGVQTAPDHFLGNYPEQHWRLFEHAMPADLSGRAVLDIGCNGGFFSIMMKERGASRVVGIDSDPRYLAQARFAAAVRHLDIELRLMTVYEVASLRERFDIVLFMGVLYHLRHPMLALDLLHEHVVGDVLVFQAMLRGSDAVMIAAGDYPFEERTIFMRHDFPKLHFVEHKLGGDQTNWWIPNRACAEAMLRSSGFEIVTRPTPEVYLCRRIALPAPDDEPALHVELSPARMLGRR